jgi:hypothetical protein
VVIKHIYLLPTYIHFIQDIEDRCLLHMSSMSFIDLPVDVSYAAPQAHRIVNVALHWVYSPGIIFIFSKGRKDLYHV